MRASLRPGWRHLLGMLLLAAMLAGARTVRAQDETLVAIKEADAQLNSTYKALLRKLRPAQQEQLRVAERAWIAFTEKENVALAGVARSRRFTLDDRRNFGLDELQARNEQLEFLLQAPEENVKQADIEGADAALNFAFQRCKDNLAPDEMELVREAQRAWVEFRNAHVATAQSSGSPAAGRAALLNVTIRRTAQLKAHYFGDKKPDEIAEGPERKDSKTNPNPFERAK